MNDGLESPGDETPGTSAEEEVRSAIIAYVTALRKTRDRNLGHRVQLLLLQQDACALENELKEAESRARRVAKQSEHHRKLVLVVALDETVPDFIRSRILDLFDASP